MSGNETFDIVIAGGGTSGAALAGIMARDTSLRVLLLEAGPDYGPLESGNWPPELLDASTIPGTHDWGYSGVAHASHREPTTFDRARVIGGCSSHNGCVALSGHRRDYDAWAEIGNTGWDWDSVQPAFKRAKRALHVRIPEEHELAPYQAVFAQAAIEAGIPGVEDLNDPDDVAGVAPSPVNIRNGVRWNTSLAYLDPVRHKGNLTVIGDVLIDRVVLENGIVTGVAGIQDGQQRTFSGRRIILSAGAYGSPAILLRSGIGSSVELSRHGITQQHRLSGVGRHLADHPAIRLRYRGSEELCARMSEFSETSWLPDEQTLAKVRSGGCDEAFDLHLYPTSGRNPATGEWDFFLYVSSVLPRSHGTVTLASADPLDAPVIDHGYLSDIGGEDRTVLLDGLRLARQIMQPLLDSEQLAEELSPGIEIVTDGQILEFIDGNVGIYYHPASTCQMGPEHDPMAVVDADGKVHGLSGLYVCDASIFPVLMRANTNLPAAMLAEHLAARMAEGL